MFFNWLDWILILVIVITVIIGIKKGVVRRAVGIASVILGIILAMNYYEVAGNLLPDFTNSIMFTRLLGFLCVFFGVVLIGAIFAWIISKMMRGPLKAVNKILGAAIGFIEGILICGAIVLAQMMFPINQEQLMESKLAPYCARMAKVAYGMVPAEIKNQFKETYKQIIDENGGENERKK